MITKSCEYYGKDFNTPINKRRFCSNSCSANSRKKIEIDLLRDLYLQGFNSREIANKLGVNCDHVKRLIRQLPEYITPSPKVSAFKQHQKTLNKREQSFVKFLEAKKYDYEYISGYKNNISPVTVRCKRCGGIVTMNASFVRKGKPSLYSCCTQKAKLYDDLIKVVKRHCQQEKKKARQKAAEEKIVIRNCSECGTEFITDKKNTYCCSLKCTKRRSNRQTEVNRRHKIKENGKVDWSISLYRLIKKYNGKCAICGEKVDIKVDPNSDRYPSIDHVFPVSRGGTHTWDNVQLAHRGCNSAKRDSVIIEETNGQLRLCL